MKILIFKGGVLINILFVFLKLILFIFIFNLIYLFLSFVKYTTINDKISKSLKGLNKKYEKRILKLRYAQYYKFKNKRRNFINDMDVLIEKSNIRKRIPFFTSELFLFSSVLFSILAFLIVYRLLYNIPAGIITGVFAFNLIKFLLNILAYKNASKTDSQIVYFINILINFCHVKNDIVYAVEKSVPYLLEPLKTFCTAFVNEVRYGISPFDALENLKNKVDNKKFKLLIKNLQLCYKYDNGSFVEVLSNFSKIMKDYTIERDRRKSEVRKSRSVIYLMMLISFAIMYGLVQINPYLVIAIRKDFAGQLIVLFNVIIYLFAVYKSITIEKFDY